MKKLFNVKTAVAGALATVAIGANAAAPDVSGVVTSIGEAATPIAAIGGAVLVVIVGAKLWKWIRSAL